MPLHDWTRVNAGLFHHFHHAWTAELSKALNSGMLPAGYYALSEQRTGGLVPDVLTLQRGPKSRDTSGGNSGLALAEAPPRSTFVLTAEMEQYAAKANRIAIRHPLGDVVAIIEIVSPGNKNSRHALRSFVEKAVDFLREGINLLIVDLFPPTPRDPAGIHKAIWDEIVDEPFDFPSGKDRTLVAYAASYTKTAYVEPIAVGGTLPDMPLFLDPATYVLVPLEGTYQTTWGTCPAPLKEAVTG